MRTNEIDEGGPIPCTPQIEDRARTMAIIKYGHRNADHLIVCSNGAKVPVWCFYVLEAAKELGS